MPELLLRQNSGTGSADSFFEEEPFDPFIEQEGQQGIDDGFQKVEWNHRMEDQALDTVDPAVDRRSHGYDRFQGKPVDFGIGGNQIVGIQETAENGHDQTAQGKAEDGIPACLLFEVKDRGGENEGSAEKEAGIISDKGCRCALQEELDDDFQTFGGQAAQGPQIEPADEYRNLTEIYFIEGRGKKEGNLKEHQKGGQGRRDCNNRYFVGGADGLSVQHPYFSNRSRTSLSSSRSVIAFAIGNFPSCFSLKGITSKARATGQR